MTRRKIFIYTQKITTMKEFKKQEIALSAIDEKTKSDFRREVWETAQFINTRVRDIFEKNGVEFTLTNVSEWSTDGGKCKKFFKKASEGFLGGLFVPPSEKERIEAEYSRITEEILSVLERLAIFKKKYPLLRLERVGSGEISFRLTEANAVCEELGLIEYSGENAEYYELLQDVAEKIWRVAEYEKENGLPAYILQERMLTDGAGKVLTVESFITDIADGEINQRVLRRFGVIPTKKSAGEIDLTRCKNAIERARKEEEK